MQVTDEMLIAAMKKAVETGLLPEHADQDTYIKNWNAMKACLQVAMLKAYLPQQAAPDGCSENYAAGWLYADWWLSQGGSVKTASPDGWHPEKYEGWWDRLATPRVDGAPSGIASPAKSTSHAG